MRFKEFLIEEQSEPPVVFFRVSSENDKELFMKDTETVKRDLKQRCMKADIRIKTLSVNISFNNIGFNVALIGHYTIKDIENIKKQCVTIVNDYLKADYEVLKHNTDYPEITLLNNIPEGTSIECDEILMNFTGQSKVSLKDIHKRLVCNGMIVLYGQNKITSNVLGLFLVKGVTEIRITNTVNDKDLEWLNILMKHFNGDKDMLDCQEELIQAGYKEYAKL